MTPGPATVAVGGVSPLKPSKSESQLVGVASESDPPERVDVDSADETTLFIKSSVASFLSFLLKEPGEPSTSTWMPKFTEIVEEFQTGLIKRRTIKESVIPSTTWKVFSSTEDILSDSEGGSWQSLDMEGGSMKPEAFGFKKVDEKWQPSSTCPPGGIFFSAVAAGGGKLIRFREAEGLARPTRS